MNNSTHSTSSLTELAISPELYALVPEPEKEEYDSIKYSIKNDSQQEPIIVWKDSISEKNFIIDGHTRYKICKELEIEPRIQYKIFESWLVAKKFAVEVNLLRRHLSQAKRVELAFKLLEIENKLAEQRQRSTVPTKGQKGFQPVSMPNGINTGRAVDLVAEKTGMSSRTVARVKFVLDNGTEEIRRNVLNGKTKPARAERQIRRDKSPTKEISLPDGKYDVIYSDAPFRYGFELEGAPDYPTLTTEQIISLKDKDGKSITSVFATDCIMFFWSPKPKISDSCKILEAWGFEFKTLLIWRKVNNGKPQRGTGHYVWSTAECLLIATKGKPGTPNPENMQEDVIEEPRGKRHSEKPEIFRRIIEKMYPKRKYLELFGRKMVLGWQVWGNQIDLPSNTQGNGAKLDDFSNTK